MYVYNITIGIDAAVEEEWLIWLYKEHIPLILQTQLFKEYKLYKVLHDNQDGTTSYCIQFFTATLEQAVKYLERYAPEHAEVHRNAFPDRHVAFRTLLEEV